MAFIKYDSILIFSGKASFFEKHIEGYFNNKFSSELQPAEIAKKLVREMEAKHSVGVAKIYVPNHYEILLSAEDHQAFLPVEQAIREDKTIYPPENVLEKLVLDRAQKNGYERKRTRLWTKFRLGTAEE